MDAAPRQIKQIAIKLSLLATKPVNYISLLGYENETDHIDFHQHAEDRARDARVFIVSLGETRTFSLREICPACRVCDDCNETACDGHKRTCVECVVAKQHRKKCRIIRDRSRWINLQPAHGSLIVLPNDCNWTHEHAVLDDKTPKGLRISFNTKCLPTDESLEDFIARMGTGVKTQPVFAPRVYDCHAGQSYPPDAVYVGCKTVMYGKTIREGTVFGNAKNPFADPNHPDSHRRSPIAKAASDFRAYAVHRMASDETFRRQVESLRGKDLLCWCKPDNPNCHAKVWLELANEQEKA